MRPAIVVTVFFLMVLPVLGSYEGLIFDEYWYIPAARSFLANRTYERPEHPPLAQLLIASNILLLGDNPLGWRTFSLVFGALTLVSYYLLVKATVKDERVALAGLVLLSVEKMFFTFSSLAVLDIYFVFFLVTALLLLVRGKLFLSAVFLALGANCKLTGLLAAPIFLVFILMNRNRGGRRGISLLLWSVTFLSFLIILLGAFDRLYTASDFSLQSGAIRHIRDMFGTHTSKNWDSTAGEPPWLWLISPRNYYLGNLSLLPATFLESSNPLIIGLSIVTIPYTFLRYVRERGRASLLTVLWTVFLYLGWFPAYFLLSRPLFSFYVLPLTPAICMSNVIFLTDRPKHLTLYVAVSLALFVLFQYPIRLFLSS